MSKRLEELETEKRKLQSDINALQTQQSLRKQAERVLLPQIEKVHYQPDTIRPTWLRSLPDAIFVPCRLQMRHRSNAFHG